MTRKNVVNNIFAKCKSYRYFYLQIDDFSSPLLYLSEKRTLLLACHSRNDCRLYEKETGRGRSGDFIQCHEIVWTLVICHHIVFIQFYLFPNCSSKQLFDCISNESNLVYFLTDIGLSIK